MYIVYNWRSIQCNKQRAARDLRILRKVTVMTVVTQKAFFIV